MIMLAECQLPGQFATPRSGCDNQAMTNDRGAPLAVLRMLRHPPMMGWIAEIIEYFWERGVEAAHRKWGWTGGIIAFLTPFAIGAFILWLLIR
ncbi:MAG: hypothetical protein P0Y59_23405 [Candidatus Sphingomonas phytovorans]|nr:hypothetical protein [Sphingomonas sp.]WEJ99809.1 MAG: hypothetical protein P0Y59_23405 [Sphingomonas sp.]